MNFGILTRRDNNVFFLLNGITRRSKDFPIPVFSVDKKHRANIEVKGEKLLLTYFRIDVKIPPLYYVGLIPFVLWLIYGGMLLWLLAAVFTIPMYVFYTPYPYIGAIRLYLKKNGYKGTIKWVNGDKAGSLYAGFKL